MKNQNHMLLKNSILIIQKILSLIVVILTVEACGPSALETNSNALEKKQLEKDSLVNNGASAVNTINPQPVIKPQWLRRAELKFKTLDLIKTNSEIESITKRFNGIVLNSNLNTEIIYTNITNISKDSSIISTHYRRTNTMHLRIPNNLLDTVLQCIAMSVHFLDYRNITCENVSLQTLANTLAQQRTQNHSARLLSAIENKKAKLTDVITAEDTRNQYIQEKDEAYINQNILNDKIEWSTIALQIYENENYKNEMVAIEKIIPDYKPSLIQEFTSAIDTGWNMVMTSLIYLLNLWPLIIIGILIFIKVKRAKIFNNLAS